MTPAVQRTSDRRGARAKAQSSPPCSFNSLIQPRMEPDFHPLKSPLTLSRQWGALQAEEFPKQLGDFQCNLVALELERTFWEKATILHAEHYRERGKLIRDRFSRHYSYGAQIDSSTLLR